MSFKFALKLLTFSLVLGLTACTRDNDDLTGPSQSTPATSTETFSGTLTPNGAITEPFSVASSGSVSASIANLEPDATVVVGLSLGTWNGAACAVVVSNDKATQGTNVSAAASGAGRLCVRIYDAAGTLAEATNYEVTVVHP